MWRGSNNHNCTWRHYSYSLSSKRQERFSDENAGRWDCYSRISSWVCACNNRSRNCSRYNQERFLSLCYKFLNVQHGRIIHPIVHPVLVGIREKILANEINAETLSFNRVSITALHSKIYGDIATPHPTERVGSITITEERNRLLITKFPVIPGLETSANRFTHPFSNTTTQHELNPIKVNIQEQGQLDDEQTSNYMTRIALLLFIDVYNTEQIRSVYGREYT